MDMNFEKWHGCKNDFVVVWLSANDQYSFDSLKRQALMICARDGSGVGADGILVLHTTSASDLLPTHMSIINQDGSLAANCGNGLRCCAGSVLKRHIEAQDFDELEDFIELKVGKRTFLCRFLTDELSEVQLGNLPHISVEMGVPTLGKELPWNAEVKNETLGLAKARSFKLSHADVEGCEIGNQHVVIASLPLKNHDAFKFFGSELQKSKLFDGGVNVHLYEEAEVGKSDTHRASQDIGQTISEIFTALPWERGVGPTAACGSGACAVAAVAFENGSASRSEWIAIDMPGGRLYARQDDPDSPITLAGPAVHVYDGKLKI